MRIKKCPTNRDLKQYLGRLTVNPRSYQISKLTEKNYSNSLENSPSKKFMKTFHENMTDNHNMNVLQEKIKQIYGKLIKFYQTNENKIISIIKNELVHKSYFYGKEVIEFLKSIKTMKEYIPNCNHQRFCHDLTNILEFLQNFYKKKCLRQIDIIQQSILERQIAIRNITDYNSYRMISKNSKMALLGDYNIYQEFKNISDKFGGFRDISPVYKALYQRMHDSERKITKVFQATCNSKQKDKFHLKNTFCYGISFE